MKKTCFPVFAVLLTMILPGAAFAGTHQLLSFTDNSSDTSVPVTQLLVTITSNADKGGNEATATSVDILGSVNLSDIVEICVQYDGNAAECHAPTTKTGFSISLPGTEKGGSAWTYSINLASTATGTFGLTINSITGTDDAVLPASTATRTITGSCTANAPTVSITPGSQTITTDGGSVNYTVSVTNNDSGSTCTNTTFNLGATDTDGGTNFSVPSSIVPSSVDLAPGGNTNVNMTVSAQTGITSASNNTFVEATEAGHVTGTSNTVTTTINVSGGCSPAAPSVSITPTSQTITSAGGTASYTVTITNNDSGGCPDTTFNLNASDTNNVNFLTPSTLVPPSVTLAEGANANSTLAVKAALGTTSGTNDTFVQAAAAGHTTGTSNTVTTSINVVPVGGDGNLLKRSVEETCHSCHKTDQNRTSSDSDWAEAIKTHNSTNLGSLYWSGDGGWGVTGGKYGAFVCTTCHTSHKTTNIYLIQGTITAPVGLWNSNNASSLSVDFREKAGTTSPYTYAMGNDGDNHTTSTRVCEACHSATKYHRYDTTGQTSANKTHNNATDCMECHPHQEAFKGAGDCVGCHKQPRTKTLGSGGTIRQVTDDGTGSGDFVRLSRHVSDGSSTEIVTIFDCTLCHREGSTTDAGPVEGVHNDSGGLVNLRNVDSPTDTTWNINNKSMDETMRGYMDDFCMACHDSNGANGIAVNGNKDNPTFVIPPTTDAERWGPFNDSDNFRNGRDGFTTRTRVLDVKAQFYNGTADTGTGYNGNPSQHAVLGGRYSQPDPNNNWTTAAWTSHVTRKGDTISSARETATLHCSDCHLSESNAHGAQNAWHMLLDGTVNNYTNDTAMGGLTVKDNTNILVCYKCHNVNVYQGGSPVAGSRMDHDTDADWWKTGQYGTGSESAGLGPTCLNCHAGDNFGNIHGVSGTYTPSSPTLPPSGTAYGRYRFMPGAWMQWKPGTGGSDADWDTTNNGTCYFPSSSNWSTCTHHSGSNATARNINYGRATKY